MFLMFPKHRLPAGGVKEVRECLDMGHIVLVSISGSIFIFQSLVPFEVSYPTTHALAPSGFPRRVGMQPASSWRTTMAGSRFGAS